MQYGRPQMGMQMAQAQALRQPMPAANAAPMAGPMPERSPGGPAPTMNQFQPMGAGGLQPSTLMSAGGTSFGVPQIMGGMNRPQPGPHPMEMPQPQQPMGRPSFGYGQGNRFGSNMGYGRGGRFGGNRGYGGR